MAQVDELDYEGTIRALQGFIGKEVIVYVSGDKSPDVTAILTGVLRTAASDQLVDEVVKRATGADSGELLIFQVGEAGNSFGFREGHFRMANFGEGGQLTIQGEHSLVVVFEPGGSGRSAVLATDS